MEGRHRSGLAGVATPRGPAHTDLEVTVDTRESSVFRPETPDEDPHPHACTDGLVFLTYTVYDEEVGGEVERLEVVPCRRCADNR